MLLTKANGVLENLTKVMDPKSHPALHGYQQNAPNVNAGYFDNIYCIWILCGRIFKLEATKLFEEMSAIVAGFYKLASLANISKEANISVYCSSSA